MKRIFAWKLKQHWPMKISLFVAMSKIHFSDFGISNKWRSSHSAGIMIIFRFHLFSLSAIYTQSIQFARKFTLVFHTFFVAINQIEKAANENMSPIRLRHTSIYFFCGTLLTSLFALSQIFTLFSLRSLCISLRQRKKNIDLYIAHYIQSATVWHNDINCQQMPSV